MGLTCSPVPPGCFHMGPTPPHPSPGVERINKTSQTQMRLYATNSLLVWLSSEVLGHEIHLIRM